MIGGFLLTVGLNNSNYQERIAVTRLIKYAFKIGLGSQLFSGYHNTKIFFTNYLDSYLRGGITINFK